MRKDSKGNILVTNMDELYEVYLDLLDKTESVYLKGYDMSKLTSTPTVIKFDNGDKDSSGVVTAEMAGVIIDIQKQVYSIATAAKGGKLSPKEKKNLELKVTVKPGCTEFIFNILSSLIPEVSKMSVDQLTMVKEMIIAGGALIALWKIGVPVAKGVFSTIKSSIASSRAKAEAESKEKLADIELRKHKVEAELQMAKESQRHAEEMARIEAETQEALAKLENERQIALAHEKSWCEALDRSDAILGTATKGTNSLCEKLSRVHYAVSVNNTGYSKEELKEYGREPETEEPEVETKSYTGMFHVIRKDYSKSGEAIQVSLESEDGLHRINTALPPDMFSSEELNEIEHKRPINMTVTGDYRDGGFVEGTCSFLVNR